MASSVTATPPWVTLPVRPDAASLRTLPEVNLKANQKLINLLAQNNLTEAAARLPTVNLGRQLGDAIGAVVDNVAACRPDDNPSNPLHLTFVANLHLYYAAEDLSQWLAQKIAEKFAKAPKALTLFAAQLWLLRCLTTDAMHAFVLAHAVSPTAPTDAPGPVVASLGVLVAVLSLCGPSLVASEVKMPHRAIGLARQPPDLVLCAAMKAALVPFFRRCCSSDVLQYPATHAGLLAVFKHLSPCDEIALPATVTGGGDPLPPRHPAAAAAVPSSAAATASSHTPAVPPRFSEEFPLMYEVIVKTRSRMRRQDRKLPRIDDLNVFVLGALHPTAAALLETPLLRMQAILYVHHKQFYLCGNVPKYSDAVTLLTVAWGEVVAAGAPAVAPGWGTFEQGPTLTIPQLEACIGTWLWSCKALTPLDEAERRARVNLREHSHLLDALAVVPIALPKEHFHRIRESRGLQIAQRVVVCSTLAHDVILAAGPLGGIETVQKALCKDVFLADARPPPVQPSTQVVQGLLQAWLDLFPDDSAGERAVNRKKDGIFEKWKMELMIVATQNVNRRHTMEQLSGILAQAKQEFDRAEEEGGGGVDTPTAGSTRLHPHAPLPAATQTAAALMPEAQASAPITDPHWAQLLLYVEQLTLELQLQDYHMDEVLFQPHAVLAEWVKLEIPDTKPPLTERRPSILLGDAILATCRLTREQYTLQVRYIDARSLVAEVQDQQAALRFKTSVLHRLAFDVEFTFNVSSFLRMGNALHSPIVAKFQAGFPYALPAPPPPQLASAQNRTGAAAAGLRTMNPSQEEAIAHILSRPPLFGVWGPPGTGKTSTLVEAVRRILLGDPLATILVCTPSNAAADHFAVCLLNCLPPGCSLLRMYGVSVPPKRADPRLLPYTSPPFNRPLNDLDKFERPVSRITANVVLATCHASTGIRRKRGQQWEMLFEPEWLFIDEIGQAFEAEAFIPLSCTTPALRSVIVGGDHKQLNPVVNSSVAKKYDLDVSLLERRARDMPMTMLNVCYRCHPGILSIFNVMFYGGRLRSNAVPSMQRALAWSGLAAGGGVTAAAASIPVRFLHVVGQEEKQKTVSFCNAAEANHIYDMVRTLVREGIAVAKEIAVISPYRLQCTHIRSGLQIRGFKDVAVGPVEVFQGQERDVIIVSTVRSQRDEAVGLDPRQVLGFVGDPKRINVAFSRARTLLVVVGNGDLLAQHDETWRAILQDLAGKGCLRRTVQDGPMATFLGPAQPPPVPLPIYLQDWTEEMIAEGVASKTAVVGTLSHKDGKLCVIVLPSAENGIASVIDVCPISPIRKVLPGSTVAAYLIQVADDGPPANDAPQRRAFGLCGAPPQLPDGRVLRYLLTDPTNIGATHECVLVAVVHPPPAGERLVVCRAPSRWAASIQQVLLGVAPAEARRGYPAQVLVPADGRLRPDMLFTVRVNPCAWEEFLEGEVVAPFVPPTAAAAAAADTVHDAVEEDDANAATVRPVNLFATAPFTDLSLWAPVLDVFTVDSDDTIALDDALSCAPLASLPADLRAALGIRPPPARQQALDPMEEDDDAPELLLVAVHIADVSRHVGWGSPLDSEARAKGETCYTKPNTVHMLPRPVLEALSLSPGQARFAVSVLWVMDAEGCIYQEVIHRTRVTSARRYSYDAASDAMTGDGDSDGCSPLRTLDAVTAALRRKRLGIAGGKRRPADGADGDDDDGAAILSNPRINCQDLTFYFDPCTGEAVAYRLYAHRTPAHRLVEELMILANLRVAEKLVELLPEHALLLSQEETDPDKLTQLAADARRHDVVLDASTHETVFQSILRLAAAEGTASDVLVEALLHEARRCGGRSQYCVGDDDRFVGRNVYHSGMKRANAARFTSGGARRGAAAAAPRHVQGCLYTQFTSPLRRYVDVEVHRLLFLALSLEAATAVPAAATATASKCKASKHPPTATPQHPRRPELSIHFLRNLALELQRTHRDVRSRQQDSESALFAQYFAHVGPKELQGVVVSNRRQDRNTSGSFEVFFPALTIAIAVPTTQAAFKKKYRHEPSLHQQWARCLPTPTGFQVEWLTGNITDVLRLSELTFQVGSCNGMLYATLLPPSLE